MSATDHLENAIAVLDLLIEKTKKGTLTPELHKALLQGVFSEVVNARDEDLAAAADRLQAAVDALDETIVKAQQQVVSNGNPART